MAYILICIDCLQEHDSSKYRLLCESCNGLLDTKYYPAPGKDLLFSNNKGIARYLATLPINNPRNLITMGEGDTPIVQLNHIAKLLELPNLFSKLEYMNPTGSFKDRGNAVQVSVLKDVGITEIADPTGGNAGHSFAAYCARAGIKFHGFANKDGLSQSKIQAIMLHGTNMNWVANTREARVEEANRFSQESGIPRVNYALNIYFIEGLKVIAYEIVEQMPLLPDHIIIPSGNGSILHGLWKGFSEMLADGRITKIPQLHAAQTDETQPIVAAFEGRKWMPKLGKASSIANGVGVPEPPRLTTLLEIFEASGGMPIAVPEAKISDWQRKLAETEGIFIEPTSALVFGALERLIDIGAIKTTDRVLLPLTGFGAKEPIP